MLETAKERAYIYDGKEVRLTGRVAKRHVYAKGNRNKAIGEITIVEISPKIGNMISSSPDMMQWVDPRHLFYVIIEEKLTNDSIDSMMENNGLMDDE